MRNTKETKRTARHVRIRKKLRGVSNRPRLCVHRSLKNMQAQLVDDVKSVTILSLSTLAKEVKEKNSFGGNIKAAQALGEALAVLAVKKASKRLSLTDAVMSIMEESRPLPRLCVKEG